MVVVVVGHGSVTKAEIDAARERAEAMVAFRRQVQAWIAEQGGSWPTGTTDTYGGRHYSLPVSGKPAPARWLRAVVLRQPGPSWGTGSVWRWWRDLLTGTRE